jgi:hypothetical protein
MMMGVLGIAAADRPIWQDLPPALAGGLQPVDPPPCGRPEIALSRSLASEVTCARSRSRAARRNGSTIASVPSNISACPSERALASPSAAFTTACPCAHDRVHMRLALETFGIDLVHGPVPDGRAANHPVALMP